MRLRAKIAYHLSEFRTHGRSLTGVPLPPLLLRKGGRYFDTDERFLEGGRRDVRLLRDRAALDQDSALLDFGCGPGRLAIGIIEEFGRIGRYVGVDVDKKAIAWCDRNIRRAGFEFAHSDAPNERYNPHGGAEHRLSSVHGDFNIIYAYSVFSHMRSDDMRAYLTEFRRVLASGGVVFVTAFVETGVSDETVNPPGYALKNWKGALHCVRFSKNHFCDLVTDAGLGVMGFDHGVETGGQSRFLLGVT